VAATSLLWYTGKDLSAKTKGRFDEPFDALTNDFTVTAWIKALSGRQRIIASPRRTNVDWTEVVGFGKEPYITVKPT